MISSSFFALNFLNIGDYTYSFINDTIPTIFLTHYLISAIQVYFYQLIIVALLEECDNQLSPCGANINQVFKMFTRIQKFNNDFNSLYWIQICIIVITSIAEIVAIGFLTLRSYIFRETSELCRNDFLYLTVLIFEVILLSAVGDLKYSKTETLYLKVKTILTQCKGDVAYNGKLLASSIVDLPFHFSAGLFNINLSFFLNITGIVVTYWIILIQFQMAHDSARSVEEFLGKLNLTCFY